MAATDSSTSVVPVPIFEEPDTSRPIDNSASENPDGLYSHEDSRIGQPDSKKKMAMMLISALILHLHSNVPNVHAMCHKESFILFMICHLL